MGHATNYLFIPGRTGDFTFRSQTLTVFDRYRELTPASQDLYNRALRRFPGGISHNIRAYPPYPVYPQSAAGARFTDVDGREIVDLWMGHYSLILGHGCETVKQAVGETLERGWHWGMPGEAQVELAETVHNAAPAMEMMRFCSTGTEATMYAVRLARAYTGKPWVLKVAGGWHGASTDLSFSVKAPFEGPEGPGLLEPDMQGIDHLHFNDIEASREVLEVHGDHLAAVIVEPMIGAGGFLPPDPAYLEFLREACDAAGALLIFDEIITGFRFRYGILADEYGVQPDLVTLGKIVGGGFPLGVYGGRSEVMALADPNQKGPGRPVLVGGGTFSCNPVTMAAGLATLGALKEQAAALYPELAARGEALRQGVRERFSYAGVPIACTGKGSLFMTHVLKGDDDRIVSPADIADKTHSAIKDRELRLALLNHNVFTVHGGGSLSSAHGDAEVAAILDAYEAAAHDIKHHLP